MMADMPTMNRETDLDLFIANLEANEKRLQARAGLMDVSAPRADSGVKAGGKLLTAGVEGHVSHEYTGVGVEATLVQANAEYNDVGGVQLGLSADSGVGLGSKTAQAKVLGTGVKADENGLEFTVLGSGVKLGSWASPYKWFSKK